MFPQLPDPDLGHHGDAEVAPGLVDLAVNVRSAPMPDWLAGPISASLADLARYPDPGPARAALAARHARPPEEVLLTAGAAQAFVLIAQAYAAGLSGAAPEPGDRKAGELGAGGLAGAGELGAGGLARAGGPAAGGPEAAGPATGPASPRCPVVVHPQFTEPEAALRAAGLPVRRVLLPPDDFALDPALVPDEADLVLLGNPTNPTSTLHPARAVARLARPGRILVVDEAFADTVPGEPQSLAARRDLPGLLVVRSLTKTWGLAGLRVGYLLGPQRLLRRLAAHQPLWPVATPALAAAVACAGPVALAAERRIAEGLAADRRYLVDALAGLPGLRVAGAPASSFVLVHRAGADRLRLRLRDRGFALRRGDTFPGLGPDWLRIAVRDTATTDALVAALSEELKREEHDNG